MQRDGGATDVTIHIFNEKLFDDQPTPSPLLRSIKRELARRNDDRVNASNLSRDFDQRSR